MRFVATCVLWLLTTAALAVALPTAWAQRTLVDVDGYAALAQRAAADPQLRSAVAAELSTQATALIDERGYDVDPALVRDVAADYTAGPAFGPQFAQANRIAHGWMFTGADAPAGPDRWVVDLAPMLNDPAFAQLLEDHHVQVPTAVTVPVTVTPPAGLRPGRLRPLATWGRWLQLGVAAVAGVCAVLTLAAARRRGMALASLGVAALLVGAAGYAGIEVGRGHLNDTLNATAGDIREIADVMVDYAEASLHHWLNLTLAAGGVVVVFGMFVAMLGGLARFGR
ncbi:hypothetical protein ACAG26_03970 [Mycobacterium sp. pUA109]|uniref:hypothetical protein n=1 Tax=Mycobacterium sp. pUA109 TaxID=3238982 RepID=UPI00351B378B